VYYQFSKCYHLQYNKYSIRSIYLTSFWIFLICLASITSPKQINKLWSITKRETFLYVILVSGVRLISKIKFHFINVLLAQMQISNVYLLAMRKGIVSTIVLREELNSFFPIILHDKGKCHVFVDINVSENPSKRGRYTYSGNSGIWTLRISGFNYFS
jgi:hypothetical protein